MKTALEQKGIKRSISTIYKVMKKYGFTRSINRHPNGITKSGKEARKAENLIKRDFSADKPMTKLFTDISEVQCSDGKLYP